METPTPQMGLRLPLHMKSALAEQAKANRRSLNNEIVKRLEESLKPESKPQPLF